MLLNMHKVFLSHFEPSYFKAMKVMNVSFTVPKVFSDCYWYISKIRFLKFIPDIRRVC